MFIIISLNSTIRIAPAHFGKEFKSVVEDEINRQYANHVIENEGLCVCLHGIEKMSDPVIHFGDGGGHVNVDFRLLMFRPFEGEIVTGKIVMCHKTGILVSVNFFGHVFIPKEQLRPPCHFENNKVWVWTYVQETESHPMYYDVDEPVRFSVDRIVYGQRQSGMSGPGVSAAAADLKPNAGAETADILAQQPMHIVVRCRFYV